MRRLGWVVLTACLLAGAAYTGWWYYLTRQLAAGLDSWAAARRAEGWTVEAAGQTVGGWPVRARLTLGDVTLRGGAPLLPASVDWHAPQLDLELAPFDPGTLIIRPRGAQRVAFGGGPALAISGARLEARIDPARMAPPWPVDIAGRSVRLAPASGGAPALASRIDAHAELNPAAGADAPALSVQVSSGRIDLPNEHSWPLGQVIESVAAELSITGPVPASGAPKERARAWRDAGGHVTLQRGALRWGPLDGDAQAQAGLDANLQPSIDGTAKVVGYAQALDVLAAHHVLSDHAALVAKAVLSLVAETPPGGGPPVLVVPMSLHDGIVAAHGIPLVRVPPLAW